VSKESVILFGALLVGLSTMCVVYDVKYTDEIFWVVFVPIALIGSIGIMALQNRR
jgi:hypothetical protein